MSLIYTRQVSLAGRYPTPFLTKEEEQRLVHAWHTHSDERARESLLRPFFPLINKMALFYAKKCNLEISFLEAAATDGMIKAIDGFDPNRGFRLSTYARHWMRLQIQGEIRRARYSRFENLKLDSPHSPDSDLTDKDLLVDENIGPEEQVVARDELSKRLQLLAAAMETLTPRERHILTERRLRDDPTTLETLADQYRVSRERVRQIEVRSFEKIQKIILGTPFKVLPEPKLPSVPMVQEAKLEKADL